MYLHIERSTAFHNAVKMMNDVTAACNDFLLFNDEELGIDGLEIYPYGEGKYNMSIALPSLSDAEFKSSGFGYVELIGENYNWAFKGNIDTLETDDDGAVVGITNITTIKMYERDN